MSTNDKTKGNFSGPMSADDKKFIKSNAGKYTPEEIAKKLRRNHKTVKKYMTLTGLMKYYPKEVIYVDPTDIEHSQYWPILLNQFSHTELQNFRYHWGNILKQFKDDILHTEELQIIDLVKLQLMMDRILKQQENIKSQIVSIEKQISVAKKANKLDEANNLQRELAAYYAASQAGTKEFSDLLKQKQAMFRDLKATRDQRVKQLESNKQTLAGWIKTLMSDLQLRIDLGLRMEKERIAANVEYERLSEYHTYLDGTVDQPILNHETIKDDNVSSNTTEDIETIEVQKEAVNEEKGSY